MKSPTLPEPVVPVIWYNVQSILDGSLDAAAAIDTHGNLRAFNESFQEFCQSITDETPQNGQSVYELLCAHPAQIKAMRSKMESVLEGKSVTTKDVFSNGENARTENRFCQLRDEKGEIVGLTCFVRDIVGQRRLNRQATMLDTSKALAEMGFWIWNSRTGEVNLSKGMSQIFGIDRDGLTIEDIREGILRRIHPHDEIEVRAAWLRLESKTSPLQIDCRLIDPAAGTRWLRLHSVTDPDNEYMTIHVLDITRQRLLKLSFHYKNLELEKTHNYIDNLVGVFAHDLRSPIANLQQISELLLMIDTREDPILEKLKISIDCMDRTVSGLIRIFDEQKVKRDQLKPVSFSEKSAMVRKELEGQIQQSHALIQEDLQITDILYFETYLESILRNLIQNALKYAHADRRPLIKLSTTKEDGFVVLSIQDNGIGINLEEAGKSLFRPFKRFTDQASGSGIGLHLIKSMVEKNGGRVEVYSEPNEGSLFNIYLNAYNEEYW